MKRLSAVLGVAFLATAIGGCSGGQSTGVGGALPQDTAGRLALTIPHYVPAAVKSDRHPSRMAPDARKKSALMYVGDWSTNDVYVTEYPSGKSVGTLTGFDAPYGMCVDAKGDVYIANYYGGSVFEYAHGGTSIVKTYLLNGNPMGCAVDRKGDLAVTSFNPGEAVVYAGGDPSKRTAYSGACAAQWPMGYDDNANLVGIGEEKGGSIVACALLAGSQSIITLGGCCTGPVTIDFPGSTTWDGKFLAIGDQVSEGMQIERVTLSGATLKVSGLTMLSDDCNGSYLDTPVPFVVGKKNTPVNRKQGNAVIGPNLWCQPGGINRWLYPKGGPPAKRLGSWSAPYGAAVSLK